MRNVRLGRFFWLSEFCESDWAARRGIIIEPPGFVVQSLRRLVNRVLDPLREELGPIVITSGYRTPFVNKGIGGSSLSQHVIGEAADIKALKYAPRQVFDTAIRMNLPFDQIILEFGQWTHVSVGAANRRDTLVATHRSGGGVDYKRIYT